MKKLSFKQWILFITAAVGLIVDSGLLGDSILTSEIVGKVLIAIGLVGSLYEMFMSFQAQDVADFANQPKLQGKGTDISSSKQDVKDWVNNK